MLHIVSIGVLRGIMDAEEIVRHVQALLCYREMVRLEPAMWGRH